MRIIDHQAYYISCSQLIISFVVVEQISIFFFFLIIFLQETSRSNVFFWRQVDSREVDPQGIGRFFSNFKFWTVSIRGHNDFAWFILSPEQSFNWMSELNKLFIVSLVSRKLTTYSSPVTSHLGQNVGLGEGRWSVSIQKPKLICLVSFFHGVSRTAENWNVGKKIPFHSFSRHFLFKQTVGLFDSSQKPYNYSSQPEFFHDQAFFSKLHKLRI